MEPAGRQFWVEGRGDRSRLGLRPDFAESLEGDWVAIDLPEPGQRFGREDGFAFVTTDRATHDLRAPFGFRVLAVNEKARANPALVALSPTSEGWLIEISPIQDQATV